MASRLVRLTPFSRSLSESATVLRYSSFGNVSKVLTKETETLGELTGNQIRLRVLASPINPADHDTIHGAYGALPQLPAVGGLEGVAVVEAVGPNVKGIKVDTRVIPATPGFGMWRTKAVCSEDDVIPVSSDIPVEYAATLAVNPCTAYRLLTDFAQLKSGDVVVQNGATSLVGQAVIQIAKARGIQTVNVVRADSYARDEMVDYLNSLGATVVVDDYHLGSAHMRKTLSEMGPVKLALNSVGGSQATDVARTLGQDGTLVTYGAMARQPVTIPASALIFKNVTARGFWMTEWVKQNSKEERIKMLDELSAMVASGSLKLLLERVKFSDYEEALRRSVDDSSKRKLVFLME